MSAKAKALPLAVAQLFRRRNVFRFGSGTGYRADGRDTDVADQCYGHQHSPRPTRKHQAKFRSLPPTR
jgi:hypothetical protein